MSPAAWGFLGAVAGPTLVFVTWLASRRQAKATATAEMMSATVSASLSTTETMRKLLKPLEEEISELRSQVTQLRVHIQLLEDQVKAMGAQPVTLNDLGHAAAEWKRKEKP